MTEPLNSRELRDAFGCFVTGITVVTGLDGQDKALGVPANSFSSLSLDPPLVQWSLGRQAATFEAFHKAKAFTITVLGADGETLSRRFASRGTHHVDAAHAVPTELGPPTFAGALAVFECEAHRHYDGGDHVIFVGRVTRFSHAADRDAKIGRAHV